MSRVTLGNWTTGFAQQAGDHVAIVDVVPMFSDQTGHIGDTPGLIGDLQVPSVDVHVAILTSEAGGNRVGVVEDDVAITMNLDLFPNR